MQLCYEGRPLCELLLLLLETIKQQREEKTMTDVTKMSVSQLLEDKKWCFKAEGFGFRLKAIKNELRRRLDAQKTASLTALSTEELNFRLQRQRVRVANCWSDEARAMATHNLELIDNEVRRRYAQSFTGTWSQEELQARKSLSLAATTGRWTSSWEITDTNKEESMPKVSSAYLMLEVESLSDERLATRLVNTDRVREEVRAIDPLTLPADLHHDHVHRLEAIQTHINIINDEMQKRAKAKELSVDKIIVLKQEIKTLQHNLEFTRVKECKLREQAVDIVGAIQKRSAELSYLTSK